MNDQAHILSQFPLFAGLDVQARRELASHMHERTFPAGQVIVLAGEPTRAVYLIVTGEASIQRSSLEGREYVLHDLGPGQCFNLVSALDGQYNLATVATLTDTTVFVIPVDAFRRVAHDHPEMATALLQHMAHRVRRLCDAVETLALYTVRTRLARCLLSSADGGARSPNYWTQDKMAAHIGTVRDVVGRVLRSFAHDGLVRRERGRLVITDPAGLKREAMFEGERTRALAYN
jgi:CRP-like cAMP-binding protein